MRSSTAVGLAAARGRFTSMPRYIIGAVSMKIRSRTSTTSTSGMMLISASVGPIRRPSPLSRLKAIFGDARDLGGGPRQEVEQLQREAVHLRGPVLHAVDEVVVADHGGDRRAQPGRGGDERFRDAGRDHREARRTLLADSVEGRDDPEDGAGPADERGGGGRGGRAP